MNAAQGLYSKRAGGALCYCIFAKRAATCPAPSHFKQPALGSTTDIANVLDILSSEMPPDRVVFGYEIRH
jgi:hypothetical protein